MPRLAECVLAFVIIASWIAGVVIAKGFLEHIVCYIHSTIRLVLAYGTSNVKMVYLISCE